MKSHYDPTIETSRIKLQDDLFNIFTRTYQSDGFDPFDVEFSTLNGKKVTLDDHTYLNDPLTKLTSFLGLPNRKLEREQSLSNIGKNLIGWQDDASDLREGFNATKAGTQAFINIILVAPKCLLNVVKLVTELLPGVASAYLDHGARLAKYEMDKQKDSKKAQFGYGILYGAATITSAVCQIWNFVGGAITSPINNTRKAWKMGNQLGGKDSVRGKILGGVLAGISVVVTAAAYTGIAIAAAPAVGAALAAHAPVIASGLSAVGSSIAGALGVSPIVAGIATLAGAAGLAVSTVGVGVSKLYDGFLNLWGSTRQLTGQEILTKVKGSTHSLLNAAMPPNNKQTNTPVPQQTNTPVPQQTNTPVPQQTNTPPVQQQTITPGNGKGC